MSTHNIGFHEDLIKIIFQLLSNIIKYASYLLNMDQLQSETKFLKNVRNRMVVTSLRQFFQWQTLFLAVFDLDLVL